MTNQQKIDSYFNHSAGKTRGRIPHENVLRWLDEKDVENARLREALAFASSVIKSGEPWTRTCERVIGGILSNDASDLSRHE